MDIHQTDFYKDQINWLKKRNECQDDKCMLVAYQKRQKELDEINKEDNSPADSEQHESFFDVQAYFAATKELQKIPQGAQGISPCDKEELQKVVSLMKNNKNIKFLDKTDYSSDQIVYKYKDNQLWNAGDPNAGPISIYKGNFSNDGTTKYIAVANSGEILALYKIVENHLEKDNSYNEAISAHVHWPDHDGYGIEASLPFFAFIKNGKTYLRYHPTMYSRQNYDKSVLRVCTYLWDGNSNSFTLVGPNLKVAYNGKLIPAADCYSELKAV